MHRGKGGRKCRRSETGQGAVEFALVVLVVLLLMMFIIETGRLLQAWLTVQSSAQAGARFAITGQCWVDPTDMSWNRDAARLQCIKDAARSRADNLRIDNSAGALDPGYFHTTVHASDPPEPIPDPDLEYPGGPNARIVVDIVYNHNLITPVLREIVPWVALRAHAEMINERYRHPGYGTPPGELPPTIIPTSTPTPTPTPTPIP